MREVSTSEGESDAERNVLPTCKWLVIALVAVGSAMCTAGVLGACWDRKWWGAAPSKDESNLAPGAYNTSSRVIPVSSRAFDAYDSSSADLQRHTGEDGLISRLSDTSTTTPKTFVAASRGEVRKSQVKSSPAATVKLQHIPTCGNAAPYDGWPGNDANVARRRREVDMLACRRREGLSVTGNYICCGSSLKFLLADHTTPAPTDYCAGAASCGGDAECANTVFERRRRNLDMASCRRRDGESTTGKYLCCGSTMMLYGALSAAIIPQPEIGTTPETANSSFAATFPEQGVGATPMTTTPTCETAAPYDGWPGNSANVARRRRDVDMLACRRREGLSVTGNYICCGSSLKFLLADHTTPAPTDYCAGASSCGGDAECANTVFERRRRNLDMASCRRRDGASTTGKYLCCGNTMMFYLSTTATSGEKVTRIVDPTPAPTMPTCENAAAYDGWPGNDANVLRRRREVDMLSCRRRTGVSVTGKYICCGNSLRFFTTMVSGILSDTTCQGTDSCRGSTECANTMFLRRRQNGDMASCRRRDGQSSTGRYICCVNTMMFYPDHQHFGLSLNSSRGLPQPTPPPVTLTPSKPSFDSVAPPQMGETAGPDVFFTQTTVQMTVSVSQGTNFADQKSFVAAETAEFLGIPQSHVKVSLEDTGNGEASIVLSIKGDVNCGHGTTSDPKSCFNAPDTKAEFSARLQSTDKFVEIGLIRIKVQKNPGVFVSYQNYAIIACAFVAVALLVRCFAYYVDNSSASAALELRVERQRGKYLRPLLMVGITFYVLLLFFKEWNKLDYNCKLCKEASENCDPSDKQSVDCEFLAKCPNNGYVMLLEVLATCLIAVLAVYFFPKWGRRITKDEKREAAQPRTVMPLRSAMMRNNILAPDVITSMRERDRDKCVKWTFIAFFMFLSFFVVFVSFHCVYTYQFPSKYAAWYPYKLLWEIFAVIFFGIIAKELAKIHASFIFILTFLFMCADIYLLWIIIGACREMAGFEWQLEDTTRVLNVTLGAGLLNFLLGPLSTTMVLALFSVYLYEPVIRHRSLRRVRLESPEDLKNLQKALDEEKDMSIGPTAEAVNKDWEIVSCTTKRGKPIKSGSHEDILGTTWPELVAEHAEVVGDSAADPVIHVHIRSKGLGMPQRLVLKGFDMVLSVNKEYPVSPGPDVDSSDDSESEDSPTEALLPSSSSSVG